MLKYLHVFRKNTLFRAELQANEIKKYLKDTHPKEIEKVQINSQERIN